MKSLILNLLLSFCLYTSFSQNYQFYYDQHGQPAAVGIHYGDTIIKSRIDPSGLGTWNFKDDGGVMHSFQFDEKNLWPDQTLDISYMGEYEPGLKPEGDLIRDAAWFKDGSQIAVICQHSDNVFFYDASDFELLQIVQIEGGPIDITLNDQIACIACLNSKEVYVIDLADYAILDVIPVMRNPSQVEVSPDGSVIIVGFPTYMNGLVAAYDLQTKEKVWESWEPFIHHYGRYGADGRVFYTYYRFMLSPDGQHIISSADDGYPLILDALTGIQEQKYSFGFCAGFNTSFSGDTIYFLSEKNDNDLMMYRIDSESLLPIDSLIESGIEYIGESELAISQDGEKILVKDEWGNTNYLFNFNDMSFASKPLTFFFNEIILQSYDRNYAFIHSDIGFTIFDFDSEDYTASATLLFSVSTSMSLTDNRALVINSVGSCDVPEQFSIYNFNDPDTILLDTTITIDLPPEADLTFSAALSHDGQKIVTANVVSGNISIIDAASQSLDTLINIDCVNLVEAIPNTPYIWLSGNLSHLLDLTDNTLTTTINISQTWCNIVSAEGDYMYSLVSTGELHKIRIDGSNTHITKVVQVDYSPILLNFMGKDITLRNTFGISPDGTTILITGFDDSLGPVLQVIDAETLEVLIKLPIGNQYSYDIAFTPDSRLACLVFADYSPIIVFLDGVNSYIQCNVTASSQCFSAVYNEVEDLFNLGSANMLLKVDPVSGAIINNVLYSQELLLQVQVDKYGIPMIRSDKKFYHGQEAFSLPGSSEKFAFNQDLDIVTIPIPGPDRVMMYDPYLVGMQDIPSTGIDDRLKIYPNPAGDQVTVDSPSVIEKIEVFDINTSLILSQSTSDELVELNTKLLSPGLYLIKIKNQQGTFTRKLMICH